mmetsp:Transcript_12788/g.24310  ORF Transcript_12788/g.24310 Transcript_12788/m.24310 type:complete len:118 (+) Transcript_12788:3-356(+)
MERVHGKQDVELGTVRDLFSHDGTASPRSARAKPSVLGRQTSEGTSSRMDSIPELGGGGGRVDRLGGSSHSDRLPGSSHSRSRGSSDYRTTATQPTGSSDSSRASRRDKKGRPVFDI